MAWWLCGLVTILAAININLSVTGTSVSTWKREVSITNHTKLHPHSFSLQKCPASSSVVQLEMTWRMTAAQPALFRSQQLALNKFEFLWWKSTVPSVVCRPVPSGWGTGHCDMSNAHGSLTQSKAGVATPEPCQHFNPGCLGEGPSSGNLWRTGM